MSVGSLGFLSCWLLPFDPANSCFLAILPCLRRVVPCAWRFFVWRVGPHGCLPSCPPFSKHSQSSLEFLFMACDPWGVAMVTPFICRLPTFICLLLALLTIGTYPPLSLLLIDKFTHSKELKVAQIIVNQLFQLQNFVCGDILL